jgi:hypothetical protein
MTSELTSLLLSLHFSRARLHQSCLSRVRLALTGSSLRLFCTMMDLGISIGEYLENGSSQFFVGLGRFMLSLAYGVALVLFNVCHLRGT